MNESKFRWNAWGKIACAGSVVLAAALAGCSKENGLSANAMSGTVAKTAPAKSGAATEFPAKSDTKSTAGSPAAEVVIQPVTPDEFQRIIASHKGNVVLADFWATYCVPCREKFPKTLELAKKYADQGLTVVSMSMDSPDPDDQRKVRRFLEDQHSQITNLTNRLEDTEKAFGALDIDGGALPHFKVFDRRGKLRAKFGGDPDHGFDEKDIEAAVVAALAEK